MTRRRGTKREEGERGAQLEREVRVVERGEQAREGGEGHRVDERLARQGAEPMPEALPQRRSIARRVRDVALQLRVQLRRLRRLLWVGEREDCSRGRLDPQVL